MGHLVNQGTPHRSWLTKYPKLLGEWHKVKVSKSKSKSESPKLLAECHGIGNTNELECLSIQCANVSQVYPKCTQTISRVTGQGTQMNSEMPICPMCTSPNCQAQIPTKQHLHMYWYQSHPAFWRRSNTTMRTFGIFGRKRGKFKSSFRTMSEIGDPPPPPTGVTSYWPNKPYNFDIATNSILIPWSLWPAFSWTNKSFIRGKL